MNLGRRHLGLAWPCICILIVNNGGNISDESIRALVMNS